jgi:hypothetical protein
MRSRLTILGLALLLGCSDAPAGPATTIDGLWSGLGSGVTASLTLTQSGGAVTGTGALGGALGAVSVTVEGAFIAPSFHLTFLADNFQSVDYVGTATDANTLDGQLIGSGYDNAPLKLKRN